MSKEDQAQPVDVAHPEESEIVETPELEAEAQDAEAEATTTSEDDEKSRTGFQKRIDKLTREKYEAQEQARQAKQQLDAFNNQVMQQRLKDAGEIPFPKLSDYNYDENDYQQAVSHWHQQKADAENKIRQTQYEQQQELAKQQQEAMAFNAKVQKAVEKYPDWVQKIQDPNLPSLGQINPAAYHAVVQSDSMADVAYYLASNPAEVYRFANLSPLQAIKEVAKLEISIAGKQSKATPPPPPPQRLSGQGEQSVDPRKMSTAEYIAWRREQRNSTR